jgi:putative colanic acid biosynthesis glycosyltransferase
MLALGEGINFLNAGDWYNGNVISPQIKIPSLALVKFIVKNKNKKFTRKKVDWLGMPYCHQGIFFKNRKKLYSDLYKISSDYQYFLDHKEDMKLLKVLASGDASFIVYDKTGISSINKRQRNFETLKIIENNFPKYIYIIAWGFIKFKSLFYK